MASPKMISGVVLTSALAWYIGAKAQAPVAAHSVTVTGCVSKAEDGSIQLTARGVKYSLAAASTEVDLYAQIGHRVTVTGTKAPADTAAGSGPELSVSALTTISATCTK